MIQTSFHYIKPWQNFEIQVIIDGTSRSHEFSSLVTCRYFCPIIHLYRQHVVTELYHHLSTLPYLLYTEKLVGFQLLTDSLKAEQLISLNLPLSNHHTSSLNCKQPEIITW